MLPWDFGLINIAKNILQLPIFPNTPPSGICNAPYLIFQLKSKKDGTVPGFYRIEFTIEIVDTKDISGRSADILASIFKLTEKTLILQPQSDFAGGSARIQISSVVYNRDNTISVNCIAIVRISP
jgi:hypothetical protein